jgi:hypothetical protein
MLTKLVTDARLDDLCSGWGKDGEIGMLTPLGTEIRDCLLELRDLRRAGEPTALPKIEPRVFRGNGPDCLGCGKTLPEHLTNYRFCPGLPENRSGDA